MRLPCPLALERLEPLYHLNLPGIALYHALIEGHGPVGAIHGFVNPRQLDERAHIVGIKLQRLLQTSLGSRQVAGLVPEPAVLRISRRPLGLASKPLLDHAIRLVAASLTDQEHRQRMPAVRMAGIAPEAFHVVPLRV